MVTALDGDCVILMYSVLIEEAESFELVTAHLQGAAYWKIFGTVE